MGVYDTDKLKTSKGGKTPEKANSRTADVGLYEHPEAKDENGKPIQIATRYDPLFGNAQSEGVLRAGFVRKGDIPEGYVHEIEVDFGQNNANTSVTHGELKGLSARLEVMERGRSEDQVELERLRAENAALKADSKPGEDVSVPAEKPVEQQNETELIATAVKEEVDLSGADTVKKKREAILNARAAKEGK